MAHLVDSLQDAVDRGVIAAVYCYTKPAQHRLTWVVGYGAAQVRELTTSEMRAFLDGAWAVLGLQDGRTVPVPTTRPLIGEYFREIREERGATDVLCAPHLRGIA